jgi:hypothetical protein
MPPMVGGNYMRVMLLALLSVVACPSAFAWGQEGHAIIAEIAQRYLSAEARARMEQILGPGVSLASVSTWADDVRDERQDTYNWHFVDIPLASSTYEPAQDCRPDAAKGDCVVAAVARLRTALADEAAKPEERREALKFLVHFIGDLHQPMHTVLEGRGGNAVKVRFFTRPGSRRQAATNLHAVWDGGLIRHCVWGWDAYVDRLQDEWLPKQDAGALAEGTVVEWVEETHKAAREVYVEPEGSEVRALGEDYVERAIPILDRQLAVAGLRLARVLNEALGSGARVYPPAILREEPVGWFCKAKG